MPQTDPNLSRRRRLRFRQQLERILLDSGQSAGNLHLYFEPPTSVSMKFPAIIYTKNRIENRNANNRVYKQDDEYLVTVVDKDPDSAINRAVSMLPKSRWERGFVSNNMHHFIYTISE